ncbi:MAG: polysaccharide deacetylase family protein [Ferruginibacter sp.]
MKTFFLPALLIALACSSCNNNKDKTEKTNSKDSLQSTTANTGAVNEKMSDAATIMSLPQVPVLCYHHIRPYNPRESASMKSYSVSPENFAEQMKALHDSGYQTILPEDLYNYLAFGGTLPAKPVMLTYDDTDLEQYTIGAAEMKKYNFKGVFFIMTIAIGKPRYMTKDMMKELSDGGHAVVGHTWDHHMVTKYTDEDWKKQIDEAHTTIATITGKEVKYFAYPFGIWNHASAETLQQKGMKLAFQLSTKRDSTLPLYTVRRMIVPGTWSTPGMMKTMKTTFSH